MAKNNFNYDPYDDDDYDDFEDRRAKDRAKDHKRGTKSWKRELEDVGLSAEED